MTTQPSSHRSLSRGLSLDVTPRVIRHTVAAWAVQGGISFGAIAPGALGTTEAMVERRNGQIPPIAWGMLWKPFQGLNCGGA